MKIQDQRFLIIGDSLTHHGADADPVVWDVNQGSSRQASAPGDLFASMLYERGAIVRTDAKVGRSANSFWNAEAGAQLIASDLQFAPNVVIVMLGTNDLGLSSNIDQAAMTQIRDAFKNLPGIQIWAVGPPAFANVVYQQQSDSIYTMLVNVFGGDHVIDARQLTTLANRAADGVHFTPTGAQAFANKLLLAFQSIPDATAIVPATGLAAMSLPVKAAIAAAGLGVLGLAGWLIYRRFRPPVALGDADELGDEEDDGGWDDGYVPTKADLKGVKPQLIERVESMVAYRVSVEDIHDSMIAAGHDEEDVYVAYRLAQNKHGTVDGFGRLSPAKTLAEPAEMPTSDDPHDQIRHYLAIGEDAIAEGHYDEAAKIQAQAEAYVKGLKKTVVYNPYDFWSLKRDRKTPQPTYAVAQRSIMDDLATHGWRVSRQLKIPHATSPDGRTRLWFKTQALWVASGGQLDFKHARSTWIDVRKVPGARFRYFWTKGLTLFV